MERFDQLTEDYSRDRVPISATVSGWRIAMVMFGAIVTLPIFLAGAHLGRGMGLMPALYAFMLVSVVIAGIASAVGIIATSSRLTTAMIIQFSFGRVGARFVSGVIGFAILGWYGVTVDVFVRAMQALMLSIDGPLLHDNVYRLGASVLMVLTAIFGFKGLDRVSLYVVPLMIVFLLVLVYAAIESTGLSAIISMPSQGLTVAQGASAGIGGFIVGVTVFPDLCRYARSSRDAVLAAVLGLGLSITLVLMFSTIPSIAAQSSDFIQVMLIIGLGLPGLALIIFATWTTNAYNLYSSSLVVANMIRQVRKWKLVLALGVLGTLISMIPILDNFVVFLNAIAITIPPVAGIYIADFYVIRKRNYDEDELRSVTDFHPAGFFAWVMGSLTALSANQGLIKFSTISAIDAMAVAFLSYCLYCKLSQKFQRSIPVKGSS